METDILLHDKFTEFSEAINELARAKKQITEEFNLLHDKFLKNIREIENEARALSEEFKAWQDARELENGDG